jgi:hypothetical protein
MSIGEKECTPQACENKKQSAEWKNILFNTLLSAINSP